MVKDIKETKDVSLEAIASFMFYALPFTKEEMEKAISVLSCVEDLLSPPIFLGMRVREEIESGVNLDDIDIVSFAYDTLLGMAQNKLDKNSSGIYLIDKIDVYQNGIDSSFVLEDDSHHDMLCRLFGVSTCSILYSETIKHGLIDIINKD